MQIIENESVVVIDVDDTLVMWNNEEIPSAHYDTIEDYNNCQMMTNNPKLKIIDPYDGSVNYLKPHKRHIALIKKYKGRGTTVVVWSAAGYLWAKTVVNALGISDYVDYIMTKPSKYVDDLQAAEILGTRIYLKDE